jgi:hypothetical protein
MIGIIICLIFCFPSVKINFLAIDFDQTMIDMYKGGWWTGSLEELVTHVWL